MNFSRKLFKETAKLEGRSSEFIEACLEYVDSLSNKGLPVVFSLPHFCQLLGLDFNKVRYGIDGRENFYSFYLVKKRSGGLRRIAAPHSNIRILQDWLKTNILDKVEPSQYAMAYVSGRSIVDNAKSHESCEVVLNLDLKDFFESITERRVYGVFKELGYASNLAFEFARICTGKISEESYEKLSELEQERFLELKNRSECVLLQGASTSPGLSNLICRKLDARLGKLADRVGANYTRYADDITFSGDEGSIPHLKLLKKIIREEGFYINWDKVGFFRKGQRQRVTGLLVDERIRLPRNFKKNIYRHLHFCEKFGPIEHFQKVSPNKGYRKEWLLGKIYFVNSVEPKEAKKMINLLNKIDWPM